MMANENPRLTAFKKYLAEKHKTPVANELICSENFRQANAHNKDVEDQLADALGVPLCPTHNKYCAPHVAAWLIENKKRTDQLQRDLGIAAEQAADVAGGQRQQGAVGDRLGRSGAFVAVEHRQLAEDLPRPERRQRDRPPVGVFAGDAEAAFADDVAGVGAVALMEDARPGRERPGHGDLGEALQLALLEVREERHAPQQLDRTLLRGLRHPCRLWQWSASHSLRTRHLGDSQGPTDDRICAGMTTIRSPSPMSRTSRTSYLAALSTGPGGPTHSISLTAASFLEIRSAEALPSASKMTTTANLRDLLGAAERFPGATCIAPA